MTACEDCLRRGYLLGFLAPRVAALLDRPRTRVSALLGLGESELIGAICAGDPAPALRFLETFDSDGARSDLSERGLLAICRHDAGYPGGLGELTDPPAVLFVASRSGNIAALEEPAVAIVGARRATGYGREVARELGRGLGAVGVPVVSGLALGIDGEVHRGVLEGQGVPIAVLAGGPDVPYPRSHRRLYDEVVARGAVISELPPGRQPLRWSFPARNRIMAGLASLTLVVEAAERSGSLITTDFATDLQRTVAAVPGPVTASVSGGSNALLRDGAVVVTGVQDVLEELYGVTAARELTRAQKVPDAVVGGADRLLLDAIEAGLAIDEACEHAGLPVQEGRAGLSRLEALGVLRRTPFGGYRRTAVATSAEAS